MSFESFSRAVATYDPGVSAYKPFVHLPPNTTSRLVMSAIARAEQPRSAMQAPVARDLLAIWEVTTPDGPRYDLVYSDDRPRSGTQALRLESGDLWEGEHQVLMHGQPYLIPDLVYSLRGSESNSHPLCADVYPRRLGSVMLEPLPLIPRTAGSLVLPAQVLV